MLQKQRLYTNQIIKVEDHNLIHQAADCLTRSFIGLETAGKWVQEPMVGLLDIQYEDFYAFTKEYIEAVVEQGYCIAAVDHDGQVGGVLAGDTNAPEIIGEDVFEGSFKDMNVILSVLEDVDLQFIEDFKKRNNRDIGDRELLHLFMLGVTAEEERHDIIQDLVHTLLEKAESEGIKAVYGEATNNKSIRVMEKYHSFKKYVTIDNKVITHHYSRNERLKDIPPSLSEGTTLIIKEL
ncbi:hypothetical protein [Halobacillus sp. A5]|uniref:hypothetical protein n=1 Tax=Halobacillus sp. A5 TaxID=2880263 RepID=UPI0020A6BA1C|nr:hypothetical protein [Halobacillus sp. A5]MCP3028508.1 hypothetical protein [Halobacillus sp. A5]